MGGFLGQVIEINQKKYFSLDSARDVLPIVRRITDGVHGRVKKLSTQLSYTQSRSKRAEIEEEIYRLFQEWHEKVRKLGCDAKGMWLVDFDSGDGYYCWQYPEMDIQYFHGYSEGFRGRVKIH